jgi:hypothetical protein
MRHSKAMNAANHSVGPKCHRALISVPHFVAALYSIDRCVAAKPRQTPLAADSCASIVQRPVPRSQHRQLARHPMREPPVRTLVAADAIAESTSDSMSKRTATRAVVISRGAIADTLLLYLKPPTLRCNQRMGRDSLAR